MTNFQPTINLNTILRTYATNQECGFVLHIRTYVNYLVYNDIALIDLYPCSAVFLSGATASRLKKCGIVVY